MSTHEIMPVERRDWWPVEYMDETMPDGRSTPSAWLYRLDDGAHRYGDREDDWETWPVEEGQVVGFMACDTLGQALLTFDDDGSARWTPRPPDNAYLNEHGDWEMGGDGPDDFEKNYRDFAKAEPGETVAVNVWRWSDEIKCRFTAKDGPPRFIAFSPPPAEPGTALAIPPSTQTELFAERG